MLDEVRAANIGLIADATMMPGTGLTVITGETGTGKTLMLGALRLVRGDTASRDLIGPHGDTAEVVARFVAHDGAETVVRRTVGSGRSRAYVDGAPVTAGELTTMIGPTVSIVSQHDQHTLTTSEGVRAVVDAMFTSDDAAIFDEYRRAYIAFGEILEEMNALGSDQRGLQRERDVLRFQIDEIEAAGFRSGDEETLRHDLERLRHVEELSSDVSSALEALGDSGVDEPLGRALGAVERIARMDPMATTIASALTDASDQLREAAAELSRYAETLDAAPEALSMAEARLAELSGLKRKYGDSLDEIERFAQDAVVRAEQIDALIESAAGIEQRYRAGIDSLEVSALALRRVREKHAERVSKLAQNHLRDLGFSDPVVRIEIRDKEPTVTGADAVRIMFASDASLSPATLSAVASGGELSRLVLALTLASGGAESAVVVFDEIDAGIGGSTALAMGEKLAALAADRQVICVTHLPQVAAFAATHFVVERTGTRTEIREATGTARVEEIARMLAGLADSDKGKEHAEELLSLAGRRLPLE
jgi:DNA repair protein RecN (Recombination protein N)